MHGLKDQAGMQVLEEARSLLLCVWRGAPRGSGTSHSRVVGTKYPEYPRALSALGTPPPPVPWAITGYLSPKVKTTCGPDSHDTGPPLLELQAMLQMEAAIAEGERKCDTAQQTIKELETRLYTPSSPEPDAVPTVDGPQPIPTPSSLKPHRAL